MQGTWVKIKCQRGRHFNDFFTWCFQVWWCRSQRCRLLCGILTRRKAFCFRGSWQDHHNLDSQGESIWPLDVWFPRASCISELQLHPRKHIMIFTMYFYDAKWSSLLNQVICSYICVKLVLTVIRFWFLDYEGRRYSQVQPWWFHSVLGLQSCYATGNHNKCSSPATVS